MKAYEKFERPKFTHRDDMEAIMDYLNTHGKLYIQPKTVERVYEDYCDLKYCSEWIPVTTEDCINYPFIEGFADYLNSLNL